MKPDHITWTDNVDATGDPTKIAEGELAMRRVIISGTREALSAEDREIVIDVLAPYLERDQMIGVGDCKTGVDLFARQLWMKRRRPGAGQSLTVFNAHWQRLGRKAGSERNGRMVEWAAKVPGSVLLAFPGPTSRGTWDCVRKAQAAGLAVIVRRIGGAL